MGLQLFEGGVVVWRRVLVWSRLQVLNQCKSLVALVSETFLRRGLGGSCLLAEPCCTHGWSVVLFDVTGAP